MGRTLPTQIQLLHEALDDWRGFRRALRVEEQYAFDSLWNDARRYACAASMAERALPFEAHFLSMMVAMKTEIDELRARLETHRCERDGS